MIWWLKSLLRASRKRGQLRRAVLRVVERAKLPFIEHLEGRWHLDTCNISGNNISYTASTSADVITVTVDGSDVLIHNDTGNNNCRRPVSQTSSITINASDGSDSVDASGSPIGVTIAGGAGDDMLVGSDYADTMGA